MTVGPVFQNKIAIIMDCSFY